METEKQLFREEMSHSWNRRKKWKGKCWARSWERNWSKVKTNLVKQIQLCKSNDLGKVKLINNKVNREKLRERRGRGDLKRSKHLKLTILFQLLKNIENSYNINVNLRIKWIISQRFADHLLPISVCDWRQMVCEPVKCSANNIKICADYVEFKIENVQFLEELREKGKKFMCYILWWRYCNEDKAKHTQKPMSQNARSVLSDSILNYIAFCCFDVFHYCNC